MYCIYIYISNLISVSQRLNGRRPLSRENLKNRQGQSDSKPIDNINLLRLRKAFDIALYINFRGLRWLGVRWLTLSVI